MRDCIHFVHGNGFPSPCYRQLLEPLAQHFDCCYLDRVGHSLDFPVTENWHHLVSEVCASVRAQASKPVIALGHSLGGVLSFLASIEQPELFKAVILLDSPLFGRAKSFMVRLSKAFGLIDHVTPAFKTRNRRQYWPTYEHAVSYLRRRALFKSFSDACLADYIAYGMEQQGEGYKLRFDPQIEYEIYRTIPHVCHTYEGTVQVPTALIFGDNSHIIRASDVRHMKHKYGITAFQTHGSHLFPFEHPAACANLVMNVIHQIVTV